jgi:hypothetical protein
VGVVGTAESTSGRGFARRFASEKGKVLGLGEPGVKL